MVIKQKLVKKLLIFDFELFKVNIVSLLPS